MSRMTRLKTWIAALAACTAACSPTLDWREFVPEGSGISVTFPCRPDRYARTLAVAGEKVRMEMLVCTTADTTFAVTFLDLADPSRVSSALRDLRATAIANVQGTTPRTTPLLIKDMTPNDEAVRLSADGRMPDGSAVREYAAVFAHGLRVYQATVIGPRPDPQGVEVFFGGLRFPR
jgi:hypothetical protein